MVYMATKTKASTSTPEGDTPPPQCPVAIQRWAARMPKEYVDSLLRRHPAMERSRPCLLPADGAPTEWDWRPSRGARRRRGFPSSRSCGRSSSCRKLPASFLELRDAEPELC